MLDIDNKKYRTLQEQVAYLTNLVGELKLIIKDKEYSIEEIYQEDGHLYFKLHDGEVIDAGEVKSISSVEIDASSHLVITYNDGTSDDLGLIKSIIGVSKNASGHVIVTYSDGTTSDLGLLKGISSTSLDANKHLIINYDNGTSQDLGAVLSGEYDLSGLDVVAQTFSQSQANWSEVIYPSAEAGLTIGQIYNRVEEINNVLYLILNFQISNNSGSDITITRFRENGKIASVTIYNVPANIGSKIVDMMGSKVNESPATRNLITIADAKVIDKVNQAAATQESGYELRVYNETTANAFSLRVGSDSTKTITNGSSLYFMARIALTLI